LDLTRPSSSTQRHTLKNLYTSGKKCSVRQLTRSIKWPFEESTSWEDEIFGEFKHRLKILPHHVRIADRAGEICRRDINCWRRAEHCIQCSPRCQHLELQTVTVIDRFLNSLISSKSMNSKQRLDKDKLRRSTLRSPYMTKPYYQNCSWSSHAPRTLGFGTSSWGVNLFFGILGDKTWRRGDLFPNF
jgi:hypothetical protein